MKILAHFSYKAGVYTYLRSLEKEFFFHLFISSSHFDQPCKDDPGQPGQDIQDRTVSVGFRGQGS